MICDKQMNMKYYGDGGWVAFNHDITMVAGDKEKV
jgi:hypothetical protein